MKADNIKPLLLKLTSYKVSVPRARHASCKCCVEIRVQKQVVSGNSVIRNAISVAI